MEIQLIILAIFAIVLIFLTFKFVPKFAVIEESKFGGDSSFNPTGQIYIWASSLMGVVVGLGLLSDMLMGDDSLMEFSLGFIFPLLVVSLIVQLYRCLTTYSSFGRGFARFCFILLFQLMGFAAGTAGSLLVLGALIIYFFIVFIGSMLSGEKVEVKGTGLFGRKKTLTNRMGEWTDSSGNTYEKDGDKFMRN